MKKYISLSALAMVLVFACQTNDDLETTETKTEVTNTRGLATPDEPTQAEIFENDLEWVAYLTAEAILFNEEAYNQFLEVYGQDENLDDVIKLSELLGPDVLNQSFANAFEAMYEQFMNNPISCEFCPEGRLHPPSGATCTGYCHFLKTILDDNCVELYLPSGLNTHVNEFGSSAHPINGDMFNDGYIHDSESVEFRIFSPLSIISVPNPIIARPYIVASDNDCDYASIYHISDFTLFLDNWFIIYNSTLILCL